MFTNFHGSIFPEGCMGAGFISGVKPKTGSSEDVETKSPWHDHVVCMEGESDTEDVFEGEPFEPHIQWAHLLS